MANEAKVTGAVLALWLVGLSGGAGAQEECPAQDVGSACDGGSGQSCVAATCSETVDGSTSTRACAACVALPDGVCADAGDACGEGGICSASGGGGGGGRIDGGAFFSISYGYNLCAYAPVDGSGSDAGRDISISLDAAAGGAPSGASSSGASSSSGGAAAHSEASSSSGCALAVGQREPAAWRWLVALMALALLGRRQSRAPA
jgi:hypothetical protein